MKSEIQKLSNSELTQKIKLLKFREQAIREESVWHIAEVDKRKLYLEMAYSSLFDYLTQEIGYSAGSAQRRVDAARLIQRIPEVSEKIKSGELSLVQISKVQRVQRQVKKEKGLSVPLAEQKEILEKIRNKNLLQTELILSQHFDMDVKTGEKKRIQQDESFRLEFTLSKEEMEVLQKAQQILSNQTGGTLKATLLAMAKKTVLAAEVKPKKTVQVMRDEVATQTENSKKILPTGSKERSVSLTQQNLLDPRPTSRIEVRSFKTVTPKLRQFIFQRDQCCQFKDPRNGRICGSKHFLEVDHITPRFANGTNDPKNLRLLCRNHNQYRYKAGV